MRIILAALLPRVAGWLPATILLHSAFVLWRYGAFPDTLVPVALAAFSLRTRLGRNWEVDAPGVEA